MIDEDYIGCAISKSTISAKVTPPFAIRAVIVLLAMLWSMPSARAHHSIAPYDLVHGTIIDGTVTKFDWENPHSHIHLDVPAEDTVEPWLIEIDSPGTLMRLGWTKNTLKPGDKITVTGNRAKDGSFHLRGVYVLFRDGRKLMALPGPDQ
jgi:hypothetical protein